jgi:hypothetical protein
MLLYNYAQCPACTDSYIILLHDCNNNVLIQNYIVRIKNSCVTIISILCACMIVKNVCHLVHSDQHEGSTGGLSAGGLISGVASGGLTSEGTASEG